MRYWLRKRWTVSTISTFNFWSACPCNIVIKKNQANNTAIFCFKSEEYTILAFEDKKSTKTGAIPFPI